MGRLCKEGQIINWNKKLFWIFHFILAANFLWNSNISSRSKRLDTPGQASQKWSVGFIQERSPVPARLTEHEPTLAAIPFCLFLYMKIKPNVPVNLLRLGSFLYDGPPCISIKTFSSRSFRPHAGWNLRVNVPGSTPVTPVLVSCHSPGTSPRLAGLSEFC